MIVNIDHIGIAVNNLEDAMKVYTNAFGLKVEEIEVVEEQKARVAIIPIGGSRIELLESTDPAGPIARHIEKRGEGIHHLALEVDNIVGMLGVLKEKGVPLVDEQPRHGSRNTRIAFVHPKGAKALIELMEY